MFFVNVLLLAIFLVLTIKYYSDNIFYSNNQIKSQTIKILKKGGKMLFIKKKKKEEEKKFKKAELGESCVFQLKKFEFRKIEDPHKKLNLSIYDNRIKEKFYLGETLGEFIFKPIEMGLAYSDVSDQMLLALVPELSKYEGSFFGQKLALDLGGGLENYYPVFFSTYRKDFFNNKEVVAHITGFAYVPYDAVLENKMISIQKK